MSFNDGFNSGCSNESFKRHICRFIGETVTIYTASGGVSGCGFTGVILEVNCDFVRLVTEQGSAPTSPIDPSCGDYNDKDKANYDYRHCYNVGSVTDIPIDKIVAFVHNAV